jgi:hypothetical protein
MKKLLIKLANFFGFLKKTETPKTENVLPKVEPPNFEITFEQPRGFDRQEIRVSRVSRMLDRPVTKVQIPTIKIEEKNSSLPKDAHEKQSLCKKYNNPKTVYRNSKGQFQRLN